MEHSLFSRSFGTRATFWQPQKSFSRANGGGLFPVGWAGKPDPHAGRNQSGRSAPHGFAPGAVTHRHALPGRGGKPGPGRLALACGAPGHRQAGIGRPPLAPTRPGHVRGIKQSGPRVISGGRDSKRGGAPGRGLSAVSGRLHRPGGGNRPPGRPRPAAKRRVDGGDRGPTFGTHHLHRLDIVVRRERTRGDHSSRVRSLCVWKGRGGALEGVAVR